MKTITLLFVILFAALIIAEDKQKEIIPLHFLPYIEIQQDKPVTLNYFSNPLSDLPEDDMEAGETITLIILSVVAGLVIIFVIASGD